MADVTRRLKRGELALDRYVAGLYPQVNVELSPTQIDYYRSLGPYAFAYDRQSVARILKTKDKVGHDVRVSNIMMLANCGQEPLHLPRPIERQHRDQGEFQFEFDPAFWFVDGREKNASGYTGHPNARPEIWRLAKTVSLLTTHGCPPKAVLIGEPTRFFRDQLQFIKWYRILTADETKLIIAGSGAVDEANAATLLCQVNAWSEWLTQHAQAARDTYRRRGDVFHTRAPFGLFVPVERDRYSASPVEWPILMEMVEKVWDGTLPTGRHVMEWLQAAYEIHGVDPGRRPTSRKWLSLLLESEMLEGVHYSYKEVYTACRVHDPETMDSDQDITPAGNRRYVRTKDTSGAMRFEIEMPPAWRIPADQLAVARRRLLNRRGKLANREDPAHRVGSYFRNGMIRCAVCGSVVDEYCPQITAEQPPVVWSPEQDAAHLRLWHAGASLQQILDGVSEQCAREIGRPYRCPRSRLYTRRYQLGLIREPADWERVKTYWDDPFRRWNGSWHLYCRCITRFADERKTTLEKARELPEAQHVLKRAGCLSDALLPLLSEMAKQKSIQPVSLTPSPDAAERVGIERELAQVVEKIQRLHQWALDGDIEEGEMKALREPLRQERSRLETKLKELAVGTLTANDEQSAREQAYLAQQARQILDDPRFLAKWELKKAFVQLVVRRVVLNLETGWFMVETKVENSAEWRQFSGQLGSPGAEKGSAGMACSATRSRRS